MFIEIKSIGHINIHQIVRLGKKEVNGSNKNKHALVMVHGGTIHVTHAVYLKLIKAMDIIDIKDEVKP